MVLIKKYFNYFGILGLVVLERVELEFVADFPEANGELVFGDEQTCPKLKLELEREGRDCVLVISVDLEALELAELELELDELLL